MVCSIDKLTILGNLRHERVFHSFMTAVDNDYVKSHREHPDKYPYIDSWQFADGSFMQYAGDSAAKVPEIRVEFNPSKCQAGNMLALLNHVIMKRVTRLDVAIDFDIDISEYAWLCPGKTSVRYCDRSGKLQTLYFGKRNSRRYFRIYDKAAEQEEVNRVWWRVEAQARFHPRDRDFLPTDMFDGLYAIPQVVTDVDDRALIYYLIHNPEQIRNLSRRQRKHLIDIGMDFTEVLKISEIYNQERENLRNNLNLWLDC